jgi:diguanylate cyclase (GGDEF)-like protein
MIKKLLKFLGEYILSIVILLAGIVLFILFFYYDFKVYGSPFYLRLSEFVPVSYYFLVFSLIFLFFSVVYLSIMAIKRRLTILEELGKFKVIDNVTKDILKVGEFEEKLKIFGQGIVNFLDIPLVGVFVSAKDGFKAEFVSEKNKDKRDYLFAAIDKKPLDATIESFKMFDADCNVVISGRLNNKALTWLREYIDFTKPVLSSSRLEMSVENKKMKAEELLKKYQILNKFTVESKALWTYEDIYWKAVSVAVEIFPFAAASIIDVSGPQLQWSFAASKNVPNERIAIVKERIKTPEFGANLRLIKEKKSVLHIVNTADYPGWVQVNGFAFSYIGIPIIFDEEVVGVLNIDGYKPYQFKEEDLVFAEALSLTISTIVQKNKKLEEFNRSSITDPLTGLYNRREFDNRIKVETERAKRYARSLSIMELDLDHFKQWNDTYGHLEGDRLLKEFANIILKSIRSTDVAFRVGGDEFMILLPETDIKQARNTALRISRLVKSSSFDDKVKVTVSIGLAGYKSEPIQDFQMRVDKALYKAKSYSSGRVFTAK